MDRLRIFASRLYGLFRKRHSDESLATELREHLDLLAEENIRRGMTPQEARYAARREFGGLEQTKEAYREQRGLPFLETVLQDLRFGARILRKSPGVTVVAVLTLALGIGANSAAFSLVDTILLRPLPYRSPERLLLVTEALPQLGNDEVGVSAAEYLDYRDHNHCFSEVAAYESDGFNLTGEGAPLRVNAPRLSASTFPLLGVNAGIGRTFTQEEDRDGAPRVALLSNALWKSHYGSDPHILGRTIKLDERPYTVIGVMPASFRYPFDGSPLSERADLWVPQAISAARLTERVREFGVHLIGRLKPSMTPSQAQADIETVAANFMRQYPETYSGTIRVAPRTYAFASHSIAKARPLVLLLQAAVFCVLLIACANVANLLLAKAGHREREMAVRRAIGADRWRLLRQCMAESLLLSFLGGGSGIVLAASLIEAARQFGPADVPQLQEVTLNATAILFTLALSLLTTVLFGIAPAWRLSNASPQASLKESTQIGRMRGAQRVQNSLGVVEIAVALVLLIGGSLLLQSFVRLLEVPLGFRPDGAVVARTFFDRERYPDASRRESVQKELLSRLSALPGVAGAAAASHLPLSDIRQIGFLLEHSPEGDYHWAENSLVSPGYFRVMGIPILRGREFTDRDTKHSPNVAVVNETFARQHLSGCDPLGQRFFWGGRSVFTIVGVAADVHISALDADPEPMIYDSMFQVESGGSERTAFVLRFADPGASGQQGMLEAIQQRVWSLDKELPIYGATTLNALVSESVAQRRFTMLLVGGFAAIALLLASIGLFGVVSYVVALRTRELAVRIALGASRGQIGWMVLKQASVLGLAGCGIGLALFVVSSSLVRASLFHVSRFDPPTLCIVPLMLLAVAICAGYLPAHRAMNVDPLAALRSE
jgi:predicted permease